MGVIQIQFVLRRPMFNILNSLTVCTLVIAVTLANAKPKSKYGNWNNYEEITEVSAEELYPPEEVNVKELASADEVDAQLIKQLEELLSVDELSNVEEVDVQEVVNKEEVSKLTPLSNVEEIVDMQEVVSKTLVPEAVVKKFMAWKEGNGNSYPYEEDSVESYESPTNYGSINDRIDILDKQLVSSMKRLKKIEEVVNKLEIKQMDEIIDMEELREAEEVKRMEEVERLEEVVKKQELDSVQELKKKEEVISMKPVKNIETVLSLKELTPREVRYLKKLMRNYRK